MKISMTVTEAQGEYFREFAERKGLANRAAMLRIALVQYCARHRVGGMADVEDVMSGGNAGAVLQQGVEGK